MINKILSLDEKVFNQEKIFTTLTTRPKILDYVFSFFNVLKFLSVTKLQLQIDYERHKTRVIIHADAIDRWIDTSLDVKHFNDRVKMLENDIQYFENLYTNKEFSKKTLYSKFADPTYLLLVEKLRRKLKSEARKAYAESIIKNMAEKSFKSKGLSFKQETGIESNKFKNIVIYHNVETDKLIIHYVANSPLKSKNFYFDYPYLESNTNVPNISRVQSIIQDIVNNYNIEIEYQPLEIL